MNPITEIEVDGTRTVDLTALPDGQDLLADEVGDTVAQKCQDCGDWYSQDDWDNEGHYGELTEASLCESCYEGDTTYPSTLHRFIPGQPKSEHEYVLFGDHNAYGCTEDCTGEVFDWFTTLIGDDWTGRTYVPTSGWRGYHDSSKSLHGLVEVETGWMTGDYGDVPWKRDSHAFLEALSDGEIVPPCDVFVLFEPTSNVFSTATTIMAPEAGAEALVEWLGEGSYDLHKALG
jgi:hypothetical protein